MCSSDLPFEPCFNLEKTDASSFRGSVSGMGFAYCDFHHQRGNQMLMARAAARPRPLHRTEQIGPIDSRAEVAARVETPPVESSKLAPVVSEPKAEPARPLELRRSTQ